ncbi:MAG: Maf family protein [Candidatus Saccharibacteria bacterium]
MKRLVLASGSPRRRQLLESLGLNFDIIPPPAEEITQNWNTPQDYAEQLSQYKARQIAEKVTDAVVLAADTIVVKNHEIMGKPQNPQEAQDMLQALSGAPHTVVTGICIIDVSSGCELLDSESTTVYFKKLSDEKISRYIETGEPFDKAGAYGIQGHGALLVEKVEGCFYNVVGLPMAKLESMLETLGINLL